MSDMRTWINMTNGNINTELPPVGPDAEISEAPKPDFLDLDKDGNKKEPMKKAAKDKEKGVTPVDDDDPRYADDENLPKISVVTLTHNRKHMFKLAVYNYNTSDYPSDKIEWIIVDDSLEPTVGEIVKKIKGELIDILKKEKVKNVSEIVGTGS